MTETILEEAIRVTNGPRRADYGPPAENHGCAARMASAYLSRRFGVPLELTARDWCMLMVMLKLSREANLPTRDNLVDIAGYARNAESVTPTTR